MREIINDIIYWFNGVNFLYPLTILFFHFFNEYKEQNYRVFKDRVIKLFTISSLFRSFRYSLLTSVVFLIINHLSYNINYSKYYLECTLLENFKENYIQYLILLYVLSFFIFYFFKNRIKSNLLLPNYRHSNRRHYSFWKYFLYNLISCSIFILLILGTFYLVKILDHVLIYNNIFPYSSNDISVETTKEVVYKRGIYLAIFSSILVLSILFNTLYKKLGERHSFSQILVYCFVLLVVGLGIYIGFYCVFNYIINYLYFSGASDWLNSDKLIGHFSIRLTALILMWSLLKFLIFKVFKGDIFGIIQHGILPSSKTHTYVGKLNDLTGMNTNYFDVYYFNQVGFYVINVFVAEYLISISDINLAVTSWFFALLPVMVDDYLAIHVYYEKYNYMNSWHRFKKECFNLILLTFSIVTLSLGHHYIFLCLYILFVIILFSSVSINKARRPTHTH